MNKITIGKATMMHLDCMEYMATLPDKSIKLILTSPPYNMRTRIRNGKYTTREKSEHFSKKYHHFEDALTLDEYFEFHKKAINEMIRISELTLYNIQIVTGSKEALFKLIGYFSEYIKDIIIWDKGHGQPSMHEGVLNKATEFIIVFCSSKTAGRFIKNSNFERGNLADIWRVGKDLNCTESHKASFPIRLAEMAILNFSKEGDLIFDPFMGLGTSCVAALSLNRKFVGTELISDYFNEAVLRVTKANNQVSLFEPAPVAQPKQEALL